MKSMFDIIKKIIKDTVLPDIILGKVIAFDASNWTATIQLNRGAEIDEVRIKSVINSETSGIFVEPKIGSFVLCALIEGKIESLFIVGYSEVVKYHLNADLIELNGDAFGGLIKIDELVDKINRLENNFLTHIHTSPAGPTGTPQDATAAPITFLPTVKNELENTKVKHG